jgi:phosphohistidine phosphatase
MNLYIIRHGIAEVLARTDAERALTKEGLKEVQKVAREVSERARKPERIFVSPYLRAKQTAEPFSERWKIKAEIAPWLMPGAEVSDVLQSLEDCPEESFALIGHMPNLGLVLSALVWGLPPREIALPKGSVALLKTKSWKPGEAKLKWLLNPDLL